ncbi:MAG: DUF3822 family protein [Bacteroidales bacterium]|nr:DUF3822 family protein [Bacteroidales bacterium]
MHPTIDYKNTEHYNLSIRLTSDGFSFYIVDSFGGGNSIFHTFPFSKSSAILSQLEEHIYQHEQLLLPYRRTELIIDSLNSSFVPNDLYVDKIKEKYLFFEYSKLNDKIFSNTLKRIPVTNVFSVDTSIYDFIHRSFSLNNVFHCTTILAEYFAERSKFGNYSKMYVNVESSQINVFCFERNRLMLVNSYQYTQLSDAAYFILNTWEKMSMNQVNDELHICGNAEIRVEISSFLKQYIQRVLPLNPPTDWYVAPSNCDYLPVDLMTLSLCV